MDDNLKDIFSTEQNNGDTKSTLTYGKKKVSVKIIALVTVIVLLLAVGSFVGGMVYENNRGINADMPLMIEVYNLIKKYYYEDISWETFQELAAAMFAGSLDNFSGIVKGNSSEISSGALGIHVTSTLYNEHIVTFAVPDMPAYNTPAIHRYDENLQIDVSFEESEEEVYIREGDKIFAVGVEDYNAETDKIEYKTKRVENADLSYLAEVMSDYASYNEFIYIVKKYKGGGEYEDGYYAFKLRRSTNEEVEKYAYYYSSTSKYYCDVPDDVGIIRLTQFYRDGDFDFAYCIEQFVKEGKKKLILDLRDNGGGELTSLQYIAQYLLKNPDNRALPIMNLIYNSGYGNMKSSIEYSSDINPTVAGLPLAYPLSNKIDGFDIVVLTNEYTASASEGLIGALQYYNGTKIVGKERTYGKGVAQISLLLSTGDYLYVTNGRYYVPTKDANGNLVWERTIHGVGFNPLKENIIGDEDYEDDRIADYSIDAYVARALELFNENVG